MGSCPNILHLCIWIYANVEGILRRFKIAGTINVCFALFLAEEGSKSESRT